MKRKQKHTGKLYEYLEKAGALSGTDVEIKAAIREYRKLYKAEWRRRKREANQEITVTLNPHELQIITTAAKKHHRSHARFLKDAALAYCTQAFVVPDMLMVNSILENLIMTGAEIQKRFEDNTLPYNVGKDILRKVEGLEAEILRCLRQPQNLEERILDEIQKNPTYTNTVLQLLQNAKE